MERYENVAKELVKLTEEQFEQFLSEFSKDEQEMFCRMRGLYKLMTDKKFYDEVQNAIAKRIWQEAQAV